MEAGALVLLLVASLATASAHSFYGDSISFMPLKRNQDGTVQATFHHRQNGRSICTNHSTLQCGSGLCSSFRRSSVLQTDQDATGLGRWCQTEGDATATAATNGSTLSLMASGCCWVSNGNGKTNWTSEAELDLGTRSDSRALNSCPVTSTVSSLRVPQNCFSSLRLLAHDPDGDNVRCSFSSGATVSSNFTLDEAACSLTREGDVDVGVHVFELMLQDFPAKNITLTYADGSSVFRDASAANPSPLCKVKLQFSVEILPPIPRCHPGHVLPVFLSKTPSHGDVLHATVGQMFQLQVQATASHSSIHDFQLSGPRNVVKVFKVGEHGQAEVTVQWNPQTSDLYRLVPVCFTAETNESQSEMRCVVVMVTQASITQGKALVECSPNKMKVTLDIDSMPGIDVKFLELRDPSCSLTSNGTHITGSMSFSTCGTKIEDAGDFISFRNEIDSFEMPNEIITRRRRVKIGFSCQFPKTISISSYYNLYNSDYVFTESSFGSFGYTFEIYRDSNFTNRVEAKAYPVEVKLLETIYMGIQAQSELPNVKLFVESCKATPDDNPENALSYDLIKNGCVTDETLTVSPSNETSFNFGVQAFKFNSNYEQVFITCSVIMCEADSPFSRCAQGCQPNASRRRRRGLTRETVGHYITQGPLQFVEAPVPNAAKDDIPVMKKNDQPPAVSSDTEASSGGDWKIKQILSNNISTVVLACAFLLSMVTMAVAVHYFRTKRKEEGERDTLIMSGCKK
ncbi:putative deleted in malignant brain tumors 1 protein-like [Scophthalmus maximus]|uniref:Putative deleted in malignant brain tumors 1 protein-like n=1 Tax=Scophthalmus maximus TaxID=52904 RepID=A0A2U9BAS1_SCOMX|nr:putative deleted in malignant brain tumors 1 protein-like [Scophthalmus maximus]